jgi:hypothetical protein
MTESASDVNSDVDSREAATARRGREVLTTKITKSTERDEEEEVAQ